MPQSTQLIPRAAALPARRRGKVVQLRELTIPRRRRDPVDVNLIFPLTPLLWLFSPLLLLALPVVNAVVIARRMDPRTVSIALSALPALSGLQVDVDSPRARVRVRFI